MTFDEANKENVEKSRLIHEGLLDPNDYEKKCTLLRKYITRGGFIKDRNGKWCKEGDKVKYKIVNSSYKCGVLGWKNNRFAINVDGVDLDFHLIFEYLELVEPCEPDICKDFEEETK